MTHIDLRQKRLPSHEKLFIRMDRLLIERSDGLFEYATNELGGLLRGIS